MQTTISRPLSDHHLLQNIHMQNLYKTQGHNGAIVFKATWEKGSLFKLFLARKKAAESDKFDLKIAFLRLKGAFKLALWKLLFELWFIQTFQSHFRITSEPFLENFLKAIYKTIKVAIFGTLEGVKIDWLFVHKSFVRRLIHCCLVTFFRKNEYCTFTLLDPVWLLLATRLTLWDWQNTVSPNAIVSMKLSNYYFSSCRL